MRDHYLIHGANALKGALKYIKSSGSPSDPRYDPRSVAVFLSSACSTLELLLSDEQTLHLLAQPSNAASNAVRDQASDFIEEFVKADQALLVSAGMDKKVAAYLFKDAEKTIRTMSSQPPQDISHIRDRVLELRESVCGESRALNSSLSRESWLRRSVNVIGGGAIVVTNVAADTILGGIASALSQAYGGYVAGKGLGG